MQQVRDLRGGLSGGSDFPGDTQSDVKGQMHQLYALHSGLPQEGPFHACAILGRGKDNA